MAAYQDYDVLVEKFQEGKINAVEFVTGQSEEMTEEYRQFCEENDLVMDSENAAQAFLDYREAIFEECVSL